MANLPITREQAIELIKKFIPDNSDMNHYLESEAIMAALARRLGKDVEYWAMLGLLHDVDWTLTKNNSKEHLTKAPQILKEAGFDDQFIQDIVSHGYGFDCAGLLDKARTREIEHALACSETITGLIHAYALMRKGIKDMKVKGLREKFKDKRFAAAIRRDIIAECEKLGLTLDEFFEISIKAITDIADKVGLV